LESQDIGELYMKKVIAAQLIADLKSGDYENYRQELQHIDIIELSSTQFEEILGLLKKEKLSTIITQLTIHGNELKELSEDLGTLTELRTLDVWSNALRALPNSLGNCTELESLHVNSPPLQVVPDSIGCCIKLKFCVLNSNQLEMLPDSLGNCSKLSFSARPTAIYEIRERWYALQKAYCQRAIHLDTAFYSICIVPHTVLAIIASYACWDEQLSSITHQLLIGTIDDPFIWADPCSNILPILLSDIVSTVPKKTNIEMAIHEQQMETLAVRNHAWITEKVAQEINAGFEACVSEFLPVLTQHLNEFYRVQIQTNVNLVCTLTQVFAHMIERYLEELESNLTSCLAATFHCDRIQATVKLRPVIAQAIAHIANRYMRQFESDLRSRLDELHRHQIQVNARLNASHAIRQANLRCTQALSEVQALVLQPRQGLAVDLQRAQAARQRLEAIRHQWESERGNAVEAFPYLPAENVVLPPRVTQALQTVAPVVDPQAMVVSVTPLPAPAIVPQAEIEAARQLRLREEAEARQKVAEEQMVIAREHTVASIEAQRAVNIARTDEEFQVRLVGASSEAFVSNPSSSSTSSYAPTSTSIVNSTSTNNTLPETPEARRAKICAALNKRGKKI